MKIRKIASILILGSIMFTALPLQANAAIIKSPQTNSNGLENLNSNSLRSISAGYYVKNKSHSYEYIDHSQTLDVTYFKGRLDIDLSGTYEGQISSGMSFGEEKIAAAELGFSITRGVTFTKHYESDHYDHRVAARVFPVYKCYTADLYRAELGGGTGNDKFIGSFTAYEPAGIAIGIFPE